jgi:hypothetical protein
MRPQLGGTKLGPKSTGRKVPHIGTILMWVRNPPIPIKFCFKKPTVACFEFGNGLFSDPHQAEILMFQTAPPSSNRKSGAAGRRRAV